MKKYLLAAAAVVLLAANPVPAGQGVTPMLKMHTTYHIIFGSDFLPSAPFAGRDPTALWALAWQGTIEGDINGVIRWWAEFVPPDVFTGVERWEIWDCEPVYPSPDCHFDSPDQLIMAGYDAYGYVSETEWAGKGVVTYARADYAEWLGRRNTDGGYIEYDPTGFPVYGEGPFVIYNTPSNKH